MNISGEVHWWICVLYELVLLSYLLPLLCPQKGIDCIVSYFAARLWYFLPLAHAMLEIFRTRFALNKISIPIQLAGLLSFNRGST